MKIVLYEDAGWGDLRPLSLTRPVWEMRCGIYRLKDKIERQLGCKIPNFICRDYIAPLVKKEYPEAEVNTPVSNDTLLLNGRAILDRLQNLVCAKGTGCFYSSSEPVAAYLKDVPKDFPEKLTVENIREALKSLPEREFSAKLLKFPWDFVNETSAEIERDLALTHGLLQSDEDEARQQGVHIIREERIYFGKGVKLSPGVVLDASEGTIVLGEGAHLMPNAVIMGPVAIGRESLVKAGTRIYGGTSIGPVCKVGGEIVATVMQGYSNKQHEGFLGHAYIGEWCNIGAGTENSDLKNNYTPVKVQIGERRVNSGQLFAGLYMGDHCKTGINTTFNTGSVMEVAAMAYGAGFQPRYIPSFHWSDGNTMKKADFERTMETVSIVMGRRGKELSEEEIAVLRLIFDNFGNV